MSVVTRKTQKDIGNYEAKFIGCFTQRQFIFIGIGVVFSVIGIAIARSYGADVSTYIFIALVCMALPCFLAFGKALCYGMKPEVFVSNYIHYHINSAKIRLYKTKTYDDIIYKDKTPIEADKNASKKKNTKKKNIKQNKNYKFYE